MLKDKKNTLLFICVFLCFIATLWALIELIPAESKLVKSNPVSKINERKLAILSGATPEQFGANGFDGKLDTAALQDAINHSYKVTLKKGATYMIDKPLVCDHSITIISEGTGGSPAVILQENEASAFIFNNKPVSTNRVVKRISQNGRYMLLDSNEGLVPGDLLHLKSNKLWFWDNRHYLTKGGLYKISSIKGNKVYLDHSINGSYKIDKGENVVANAYSSRTLKLQGISFTHPKPYKTVMVKINFASNVTIYNVSVENSKVIGIFLNKTYLSTLDHVNVLLNTTKDIDLGYGIQDYGGSGNIIKNSTFRGVRRGVDFSGDTPSRYGMVTNCKSYGAKVGSLATGYSGFGTHSTAEHITFQNNYVENYDQAFLLRGNYITLKNNIQSGDSNYFVSLGYGNHVELVQNSYKSTNKRLLKSFIFIQETYNGSIITNGNTNILKQKFISGNLEHLRMLKEQKKITIN